MTDQQIRRTTSRRDWSSDERVPCTCPPKQPHMGYSEMWLIEHWLHQQCPRHDPLPDYVEGIEQQLQQFDAATEQPLADGEEQA